MFAIANNKGRILMRGLFYSDPFEVEVKTSVIVSESQGSPDFLDFDSWEC